MAKVRQFTWKVPGQRTKRKAWGYVGIENGKQFRQFKSEWSREQAQEALAQFLLKIEQPKTTTSGITFAVAVERYLATKARKRSLSEDTRLLGHLKDYFGKDTPLAEITAARVADYKGFRLSTVRKIGEEERPLAGATVNRALALLRHLLRLAHEEWEVIARVPRIRLEREAEGRLRWLVPLPVSWTREGDITIAPPGSIVDPDATARSCFVSPHCHAAIAAARAATGV